MKKLFPIIIVVLLLTMELGGCKKKESYPDVPNIEFQSFIKLQDIHGIDSLGIMRLGFTDGGGDIGLSDWDTLSPFNRGSKYYYNFFINYYEKINGVLKPVTLPANTTFNARIPRMTGSGMNIPTKGTIDIVLYINNPYSTHDTIAFDGYIVDRGLNESNIIHTPELVIKKH